MLKTNARLRLFLFELTAGIIGVIFFCGLFLHLTTCFVAYVDEGGNLLFMQQVPYGEELSLPDGPEREGYTFVGWDTDARRVRHGMQIHAKYKVNQYAVRFLDKDGSLLAIRTCPYGTDAEPPMAPDCEGYVFVGWSRSYTNICKDIEVTARYEEVPVVQEEEEVASEEPLPGDVPETEIILKNTSTKSKEDTNKQSASVKSEKEPEACSYCGSQEHLKASCAKRSVNNGAIGRWVIPNVGVNVACYDSNAQSVCDRKDSAASWQDGEGKQRYIGDHWNQGFDAIKNCVPGTKAYMDDGETKTWYVCTSVEYGHNTGEMLVDNDYQSITDRNPGGMTCYTCNGNWKNVALVFFAPT